MSGKGPAIGIPTARCIDHVAFTVPSLAEAVTFFCEVLGCQLVYEAGPFEDPTGDWMATAIGVHPRASLRLVMLRAGSQMNIELFEYTAPEAKTEPPANSDVGGHHIGFYVDDLDSAVEYLRAVAGVEVMGEPTNIGAPQPNAGGRFVYFRTPWGLQMELISAPAGMAYEAAAVVRAADPPAEWDGPQAP